jgi:hypothetical protein
MIYLPAIGFGLLVIGLRLIILWKNLRRPRQVLGEALLVVVIGLIAFLAGTFWISDVVLQNTGQSIIVIGFILLVQWAIQTYRCSNSSLRAWALGVTILGFILIVIYVFWLSNLWRSVLMWQVVGLSGLMISFAGAALLASTTVKNEKQIINEYASRIMRGPLGSEEQNKSILDMPHVKSVVRQSKLTKVGLWILAAGFICQFASALALFLIN